MKLSHAVSAILAPTLLLFPVPGLASCPLAIIDAILECGTYIPPDGDFLGGRDVPPSPNQLEFPLWHLEILTADSSADRAMIRGNVGEFAVFCKTDQLSSELTELARVDLQSFEVKMACYEIAKADWCSPSRAYCA
jgi:hypothetical protein